jgi:hypothetical protein
MLNRLRGSVALSSALLLVVQTPAFAQGFVKIFDGKSLNGWKLVHRTGPGYIIREGNLVVPKDGGGNLFTEKVYKDFVLRCQFKTEAGGNNGVGIRAPLEGDSAWVGMEVQILDDPHPMYANLEPGQYCGSVYKVFPAKRGALKPAGEWNQYEISAIGRKVEVKLNGKAISGGDINEITDPKVLLEHPGCLRDRGHIGFLGHGPEEVEIREIYVKDLSKPDRDNTPPAGFKALFNGKDLSGWKGLVSPDAGPPGRAKMTPQQLADAQVKADQQMRDHWRVVDGALVYDGKGQSLCTAKDYGDFEMLVDWKIKAGGDSGIYLRGSPQVQIWDPESHGGIGSAGLYNNQKNPANPSKRADKPIGEWNRFRILMIGDKVIIHLNDELVVNNVTLENYWERDKPIYARGQIELQHHGDELQFKNVYIREIPRGK